jgi:hypothetical protein
MIAKEVRARKGPGSFAGLVRYLTKSQGRSERVGQIRLSQMVSADVEGALLEVQNVQARNQRVEDKTYHLILSFREASLEPQRLEAIEDRTCAALGFAEHQRLSVVHGDTDHLHVHIAINRIHPTTGRGHSPAFSKLTLDRLCVELETELQLEPDRHRARERDPRAQVPDAPTEAVRAEHVQAAGPRLPRVHDMEAVSGIESLGGWIQRTCAAELRSCDSWARLHEVAGHHGLSVRLRGAGLAFVDASGLGVRASNVDRSLSKGALERRLGPFKAGPPPEAAVVRYARRPTDPATRNLHARYVATRSRVEQAKRQQLDALGEAQQRLRASQARASRQRWALVRLMAVNPLAAKVWAAGARLADRRAGQHRLSNWKKSRARVFAIHPRPGWLDWLREQALRGDVEAIAALRRRAGPRHKLPGIEVRELASVQAAARGAVLYKAAGGCVLDEGKRLTMRGANLEVAEKLLEFAVARCGPRLGVAGDVHFKAMLVVASVSSGLEVQFADPMLEARRLELCKEVQHGQRQWPVESRARSDDRNPGSPRPGSQRSGAVPDAVLARSSPAARPNARLRRLSELHVVSVQGDRTQGLLQGHARRGLGERQPPTDPRLRRSSRSGGGGLKR